eukprot:1151761-Pelagomonas_calceolata.AAC.2
MAQIVQIIADAFQNLPKLPGGCPIRWCQHECYASEARFFNALKAQGKSPRRWHHGPNLLALRPHTKITFKGDRKLYSAFKGIPRVFREAYSPVSWQIRLAIHAHTAYMLTQHQKLPGKQLKAPEQLQHADAYKILGGRAVTLHTIDLGVDGTCNTGNTPSQFRSLGLDLRQAKVLVRANSMPKE